jgi:hypothetical protein
VSEVLFRQVHPDFVEKERPSSQPFAPTTKDNGKLSVDREELTSAKASYDYYTGERGLASVGVCGLTVGEFAGEQIGCIPDPVPPTNEINGNPAHAYADYSRQSKSRHKNIAKRLKQAAIARGWLHGPHGI